VACQALGATRVLLAGASELAEIAAVRSHDHALEIVGTFEPGAQRAQFVGRPVWHRLEEIPDCDAVLFTALEDSAAVHQLLLARFDRARVIVPDIVGTLLEQQDPTPELVH